MSENYLPKVSVVIPCYNGVELFEKYLPLTLKSLRQGDEVIVVDDFSTDESVEFLKKYYPFIKIVELKKNQGFSHTVNAGFNAAIHDYVCLLNSDVAVEEGFLEPLLEHFKYMDVFSVSSLELHPPDYKPRYNQVLVDFKWGIIWYKHLGLDHLYEEVEEIMFTQGSCTVYDKKKFLELGGMDVLFSPFYWEDMDICFRAWKRGWRCLCDPKSRHRHEHQASIGRKHSTYFIQSTHWKNRFLFIWKNITSPDYILQHLLLIVPELILMPLRGRWEFSVGFFKALGQLPEALAKRVGSCKKDLLSDKEIINRFNKINQF